MQMAIDVAGFTPGESDRLRQAMGSKRSRAAHGGDARPPPRGHGRARHHRRGGRRHRAQDRGLRRLRLPREPLGELRLPRVLELVDQAALPGRVRVRAAQRATDGLLLAAHHRARRHPSRGGGARSVRRRRRGATARWSRAPRRPDRSGVRVRAGTPTRRSTPCGSGSATCAGSERRVARPHRRRPRRAALHRPRRLHPAHRRAHRRARGARHRGRVRVLRPHAGARRCGPRARCATRGPTSCPGWSPAPRRRRCRGCTRSEEIAADLWATGLSAARHPTELVRDRAGGAGDRHRGAAARAARPHRRRRGRRRHAPPAAVDASSPSGSPWAAAVPCRLGEP